MQQEQEQPQELVTIATFSQPTEAHIVRAKLETEDIWAFVANEHTVGANWLYSNAIGGVKLQVRQADVRRAQDLLDACEDRNGVVPQAPTEELDDTTDVPQCPNCGSEAVHYIKYARRPMFLSWLVLQFPLPFLKRQWQCAECGHKWKAS